MRFRFNCMMSQNLLRFSFAVYYTNGWLYEALLRICVIFYPLYCMPLQNYYFELTHFASFEFNNSVDLATPCWRFVTRL